MHGPLRIRRLCLQRLPELEALDRPFRQPCKLVFIPTSTTLELTLYRPRTLLVSLILLIILVALSLASSLAVPLYVPPCFLLPAAAKVTKADRFGRRWGMGIGCFVTIIATFMQTFAPNVGVFIGGRVVIGLGQGIALSTCSCFAKSIFVPC